MSTDRHQKHDEHHESASVRGKNEQQDDVAVDAVEEQGFVADDGHELEASEEVGTLRLHVAYMVSGVWLWEEYWALNIRIMVARCSMMPIL